MNRGAWQGTDQGVNKKSDMSDRLTKVNLFRESLHPSLSYKEDALACTVTDE